MSDSTKALKSKWQDLEAAAVALQKEKDDAVGKLRSKYADRLRKKVDEAAAAQKEYLDAEAVQPLLDRPDGEAVAKALGLELPG